METSKSGKKAFPVTVSCDWLLNGDNERTPALIYENLDLDRKIPLTKDYDGICFTKSEQSPLNFIFTGVNIIPTVKGDVIYPDLKISTVTGDKVEIEDGQINIDHESVGNIVLFFILTAQPAASAEGAGKPKVYYSSDPEVINTGVIADTSV